MATLEELEGRVRESGTLESRLDECHTRIGKMCSERRPPSMTIPVQWYDDDFFISTTLKDAITALTNQSTRIANAPVVEVDDAGKEAGNSGDHPQPAIA